MLEVLLSTDSFGEASNQLTSMLTLSDEDRRLAAEIRETRQRLAVRQQTLRDGQVTLTALRDAEKERTQALAVQQRQVDDARQALRTYQAPAGGAADGAGGAVPPVGAQRAAHQGADR